MADVWVDYIDPSNGIAGGYTGGNISVVRAMVAFSAIAWYNSVELIFLICIRFKKWRGLYFWSLMSASWAIIIYQVGCYGKMNRIIPDHPFAMCFLTNVAWIVMVTGESLVLYSRLHLLSQKPMLLKWVLWGIIVNSFCCYVPTTVLDYSANVAHPNVAVYVRGYSIMERVQMTLFTIQEVAISTIYLVEAYRFLRVAYIRDKRSRNIMYELLAVNVIIIAMDIALLTLAQLEYFAIEVTLKGLIYSVKLKLELGVLSRLVQIVSHGGSGLQRTTTAATIDNTTDQAFGGLDFCTAPFQTEKPDTKRVSNSTSDSVSEVRRPSRPRLTVPWLATSMRVQTTDPAIVEKKGCFHRNSIQRTESYANAAFLTSAAVTEGANDDNIRQFNREIEAELSGRKMSSASGGRGGRPVGGPGREAQEKWRIAAQKGVPLSPKTRPVLGEEEEEEEEEEEGTWENQMSVLGKHTPGLRPERSDDSLGDLYPGRITGEHG